MIDAVLMFGALNVLFEFVLLCMFPANLRLRLLGSEAGCVVMHLFFLLANLVIHWGTLVGTMSGILAFVASIATLEFSKRLFGRIVDGRYYHVGWKKYSLEELK